MSGKAPSRRRVLVVDDEPDAVELVKFNLKGAGFDVVTAADGEEALTVACRDRPHLVLLDVSMPKLN